MTDEQKRYRELAAGELERILAAHAEWSSSFHQEGVRADLMEADLRGAKLWGAKLKGADLRGADLSGADLMEADLSEADLSEADLSGAELRGARLGRLRCNDARLTNAAVGSDVDLVTDAIWDQLKIGDAVYRRDQLHVTPLPFGMGPSFALSLPFVRLSAEQLKLLHGVADTILAAGTLSMVVHLGGEDRMETRAYGPGREEAVLNAVARVALLLEQLVDKIDRPAWLGVAPAELLALLPRLKSTFNILVAEQDASEIVKAKRSPGMELVKKSAPKLLSKLLGSLTGGG